MSTYELIFGSEAHAEAAISVIDAAKGLTGGETWDLPKEITTGFWRIAKPDDGSDSGVSNLLWTQDIGYSKLRVLYNEDGGLVDDDSENFGGFPLEDEDGSFLKDEPITYDYNASFVFDGFNERGVVSDDDTLSFGDGSTDSAFSVAMWIKTADFTQHRFFGKLNEYRAYAATDDRVYFEVRDASASSRLMARFDAITAYEDEWTLFVFTYSGAATDSTDLKMYINGGSAETSSDLDSGTYTAMENGAGDFTINYEDNSGSHSPDDPKFSYVALFDKELSEAESSELYNGGSLWDWSLGTFSSNIVSFWKLNGQDDPSTTATDVVGSNDMTFVNMDASNLDSTDYPGA